MPQIVDTDTLNSCFVCAPCHFTVQIVFADREYAVAFLQTVNLGEVFFDFERGTVTINKSYQRIDGRDVITEPKTPKSNRVIKMPDFLIEEIKEYLSKLYGLQKSDRVFNITKNYLHREMTRGADEAGVKRIRIHDLRHSHISLLIEMGYSAVAIADRVGHESINITYNYAHLFPSTQTDMADKLNNFRKEPTQNVS